MIAQKPKEGLYGSLISDVRPVCIWSDFAAPSGRRLMVSIVTYEESQSIPVENENGEQEYACLLRATDGKETTIATHVHSSALPQFHAHYGVLLKSTMTQTLRKRDKKKEKARQEIAALKKKKMLEGVTVTGPKRGKGRKKRTRLEKAKTRLEEGRKRMEEKEKAS